MSEFVKFMKGEITVLEKRVKVTCSSLYCDELFNSVYSARDYEKKEHPLLRKRTKIPSRAKNYNKKQPLAIEI